MTEKTILIRPAHPKADIPDPTHGNAPLPYAESGVEVVYDAYWAGHIARGDVVIVQPVKPAAPAPAPAPAPVAEQK